MSESSVYYAPEKFGLTPVAEIELDNESYQFHIAMVWRHEDGTLYTATDSGCSCPSPFEDYTRLEDLTRIVTQQQVDEEISAVRACKGADRDDVDRFVEKLDTAWREFNKARA